MSFERQTYRSKGYRIGRMNRRLKIFLPLSETTEMGGEKITYTEWIETFAAVENLTRNDQEDFAGSREVSFDSLKFILRFRRELHTKMLLEYDGKQLDITSINELLDTPSKHYSLIRATYKEDPVTVLANVAPQLIFSFSQKFSSASGDRVTITNGVLQSESINDYLFVYRSGVRQFFPENFTIDNNDIVFKSPQLRSEIVFVQQFKK